MESLEYDLFSAIRYDPALLHASFNTKVSGQPSPYLLFPYHLDRLVKAATAFGWHSAVAALTTPDAAVILRQKCDDAVEAYFGLDKDSSLRLRILASQDGTTSVEVYPTTALPRGALDAAYFNPDTPQAPPPPPVLNVQLDTQPTPSSAFTSYKTTARAHYDAARARAGIIDRAEPREVVLYNEHGELTEASLRNVAFWRGGCWVAPRTASGGLPGTVRRWLMENALLREDTIMKSDVRPGDWVLLSNGVDVTILGRMADQA